MKLVAKLSELVREAGVMGASRRVVQALLWRLYSRRVFIVAVRSLDESVPDPPPPPGFEVHPITTDQLERIQRDMGFKNRRMEIFRARLEHGVAGIMAINGDGEVVYTNWWAKGPQPFLGEVNQTGLQEGEIMIVDSICRPDARGRGLHSALFPYCLRRAWEQGFRRAYVMHLSHNRAARHIHEDKCGMKPIRTITHYLVLGMARARSRVIC